MSPCQIDDDDAGRTATGGSLTCVQSIEHTIIPNSFASISCGAHCVDKITTVLGLIYTRQVSHDVWSESVPLILNTFNTNPPIRERVRARSFLRELGFPSLVVVCLVSYLHQ